MSELGNYWIIPEYRYTSYRYFKPPKQHQCFSDCSALMRSKSALHFSLRLFSCNRLASCNKHCPTHKDVWNISNNRWDMRYIRRLTSWFPSSSHVFDMYLKRDLHWCIRLDSNSETLGTLWEPCFSSALTLQLLSANMLASFWPFFNAEKANK